MSIEEFWEKYTSESTTKFSDEAIVFFRDELNQEIKSEYDIGEIIVEFIGQHENVKKFDKIEEFDRVLRSKHPVLYEKEGAYIHDALTLYYCFSGEKDNLKSQVEEFIKAKYDYDYLLITFKRLLYFNHLNLVDYIIVNEYNNVSKSDELIEGAEYDLGIVKFYIELEAVYSKQAGQAEIDLREFSSRVSEYDFTVEENYLNALENGFSNEPFSFSGDVRKERIQLFATVQANFLQTMLRKNYTIPSAGLLWEDLREYFESYNAKEKDLHKCFTFKKASVDKFLNSKRGFLFENTAQIASFIWGGVYFLDFLLENKIINEALYHRNQQIFTGLKNGFKSRHKFSLWKYSFIHLAECSDYIDELEWENEKKEFQETFSFIPEETEEFSGLDFLMDYLQDVPDKPLTASKKEPRHSEKTYSPTSPTVKGKKIGRNEKVDVKYQDGTIKKGVKYKKVMRDVENGDCEVME